MSQPLHVDKSLKYGVGLAVALVALISIWSWRTLHQASVPQPLSPIRVAGSSNPIAVVAGDAHVAGVAVATPPSTVSASANQSGTGQVQSVSPSPSAPRQNPVPSKVPSGAHITPPKTFEDPEDPSLLESVLSTAWSLL